MHATEWEGSAASFLALFNSLEHEVRRVVHATTYLRFYELVDAACERCPSLEPERAFLRVAGDLRNSIVHWKAFPNEVPAAPSPFLVERLEAVLGFLRKPPRVLPRFRRRLRVFHGDAPLGSAVEYMVRRDYSQVVVRLDGRLGLLTTEDVTRWLGESIRSRGRDPLEASLREALGDRAWDGCEYLRGSALVDDALRIFESAIRSGKPRVHAILVTTRGWPEGRPLGIITPWDLLGYGLAPPPA